jgi:hypothetical protein
LSIAPKSCAASRGSDGTEVAVEEAVERPGLAQHERGAQFIQAVGGGPGLIEQSAGGRAITGHAGGDRGHGE